MSSGLIAKLNEIKHHAQRQFKPAKECLEQFGLADKTISIGVDNQFDMDVHALEVAEQHYYNISDPRR